MTLDEIKALGLRLAELCQKYGIAELSVFGSGAARAAGALPALRRPAPRR
jgi:predicted nucleotidyltransferase